ncbi:MAG: hypothetical protein Q9190_007932 [Brigantiaea leucoxantha]
MELNKIYQFRQRDTASVTAHTRLIVGHINKADVDDDSQPWDFEAFNFQLVLDKTAPHWYDDIYGGKCLQISRSWQCRDGAVYKFKGEVDIQNWEEVQLVVGDQAQAIIDRNDCYSLLTNNCKQFASKLATQIAKPPNAPTGGEGSAQPFDMQVTFE